MSFDDRFTSDDDDFDLVEPAIAEEIAAAIPQRRAEKFEEALRDVASEWVDADWLVEAFTDELRDRITLGIRLFPDELDVNPTDIQFGKESGLIVDAVLRFPDVPGGSVALDSPEHRERTERIEEAVDAVRAPDGIVTESVLAAGHTGETPHVEVSEMEKVAPKVFAEWVNDLRIAISEEFEADESDEVKYWELNFGDPDDRMTALEGMKEEYPDEFRTAAGKLVGVAASEYDDENDAGPELMDELTIGDFGDFEEGQPLEYWETLTSGVAKQMMIFLKQMVVDGEDLGFRTTMPQMAGVDRYTRRLERMGADVSSVTEIGDDTMVNFHAPGADPDELPGGIQFTEDGRVAEATIRFPSLQEASQATRGVLERFPEVVRSADPLGDRIVHEAFDGHQTPSERGERLVRTRLNDLRGTNKVRPHVHLDGIFPARFDAGEVMDFIARVLEAYEAEFAPYAPRDDIEFAAVPEKHQFDTEQQAEKKAEELGCSGAHKMPNGMWMPCGTHGGYHGVTTDAQMTDLEVDIQNLTAGRGHSYRNFDPDRWLGVLAEIETLDDDAEQVEMLRKVRESLKFIEGARFEPFLENVSEFFDRLDNDEQELFTKRNPDTVKWMAVWNRANEFRDYDKFVAMADENEGEDRYATDPPAFEDGDGDITTRRRSYRNYSPGEFVEYAHDEGGKFPGREALERVESGRFKPMLRTAHKFFAPLDPDERTMWARRNPGLMEWISVEGWLEDLIYGDQLFTQSKASFPFVDGAGPRPDEFGVEGKINAQSTPAPLRNALDSFDPDAFEITGTGSPRTPWYSQWDAWYDAESGVSGLYFPEHGFMLMDNRGQAHHNEQWRAVIDRDMVDDPVPSPVMPFTMDMTHNGWRVEMARSHGGLFQAVSRMDMADEVKRLVNGDDIDPVWVWDVVYAARLAGIPESGEISYSFRQPGVSADPNYTPSHKTGLDEMYRELEFEGKLPEPEIDREALADESAGIVHAVTVDELPPGRSKQAARTVLDSARDWGYDIDVEGIAGMVVIEFYPNGFPRPDDEWLDNPTSIVISEDGRLRDAMFRYGFLPDAEWHPPDEKKVGDEIFESMLPAPEGTDAEYDLGDFGESARPHLHLAGTEFGSSGDVDWEEVMAFGREFGDRLLDETDV